MTANYHTHTRWCRHGTGEIEDYIRQALLCGLKELAITEHVPIRENPDPHRMQWNEFEQYNTELDGLINRYAGQIRVRKGFECEYCPDRMNVYRRFREEYGYEILILGHHVSKDGLLDNFSMAEPWQVTQYAGEVCEALQTGLFTFLAHPDLPFYCFPKPTAVSQRAMHSIFAVCEARDIPVEINANGWRYRRGYPCPEVWRGIAPGYRLRCLVSSDAHKVKDLLDPAVSQCAAMAQSAGLAVAERLP